MTNIAVLPERTDAGIVTYRAVAGERQSAGRTVGEALDALTPQLSEDESGTLVIVQNQRPDAFFSLDQQQRLEELMTQRREARDAGSTLPVADQSELQSLVEDEIRGTGERATGERI